MEKNRKTTISRLKEIGNRDATVLENTKFRVMIDDQGSMIPELSVIPGNGLRGSGRLNAHWLPWFRGNSGRPYNETKDSGFWKAGLLYNITGNFPCIPNFGPGLVINGIEIPAHGWTANSLWKFNSGGADDETGAAWAYSVLDSPDRAMPLSFKKIDAILPEQNIHYVSIKVSNNGETGQEICAGWHNTLGAPFLAEGCRITAAATAWTTAPAGSEFEPTARLAVGAEFDSLKKAPLIAGGTEDISQVPGPTGFTDLACGRIGEEIQLGWSSVVNPSLKTVYISFFPGPAAQTDDDIILRFTNLWMQYGGRSFTPWAAYDGGADLTYCLGCENALSAWAQGLEFSRGIKKLMGAPTTVIIPAGKSKTVRYGCLFAPYEGPSLNNGVLTIDAENNTLVGGGSGGCWRFNADPFFTVLKTLEKKTFS
ncbi:MAG: hypothetical protein FWD78_14085 [Treponema sp.]|nr:hypothetical protein [Treponema sp.]